jgi:outer membrane protein TolC
MPGGTSPRRWSTSGSVRTTRSGSASYLPKATQARDTVDYAYRREGASLLDFLDAQRSYRETALAHLQALAGYLSAIYQLEADIGSPLGN